jgi:hypothetical protein
MQRRVIEIAGGRIIRDAARGAYSEEEEQDSTYDKYFFR